MKCDSLLPLSQLRKHVTDCKGVVTKNVTDADGYVDMLGTCVDFNLTLRVIIEQTVVVMEVTRVDRLQKRQRDVIFNLRSLKNLVLLMVLAIH